MLQQSSLQNCETLPCYIELSNSFYQELLGYKPKQTSLQEIPESKWNEFVETRGLNPNSSGVYLPRNQTTIIPKDNKLSLFHEYYGHGLYCEQSLSGIELVNLEKSLLEEEKEFFKNKKFSLKELEKFRKENKTFNYLQDFKENNLRIYEGFAVFSEYFLSKELGIEELFEKKYEKLNGDFRKYIDDIILFNKNFGDLATFYVQGLARRTTPERVRGLLVNLYKKKSDSIKLGVLFGSRKPFSDIDLFIVSDDIEPSYCDWLDVRAYKPKDIEEKIRTLDSRITDPIIVGSLIFGNEEYLSELKGKVLAQPITDEAIKHNLEMAEYSRKRSLDSSLGKTLQAKNLRSSKIYLTNAIALKNGDKILTSNDLLDYSRQKVSQREKFIELEGGIIE